MQYYIIFFNGTVVLSLHISYFLSSTTYAQFKSTHKNRKTPYLTHPFESYLHWCTCLLSIISSFNVFSLSNSKLTLLAKYLVYDLSETELWIWSTRLIWNQDSALSNVGGRGSLTIIFFILSDNIRQCTVSLLKYNFNFTFHAMWDSFLK
jgi:hypothetical protein